MELLRKFKIGARLYAMFFILVFALIMIAYSGVTSRVDQINETKFMKEHYIDCLRTIADINITTGNLFLSYRNYYLEYPDQEKMNVRLVDINERTDFVLTELTNYRNMLVQINSPQEEIDMADAAIKKIQDEVIPFNEKIIGLMQAELLDDVHALIISKELRSLRSSLQDDLITVIYNNSMDNANSILDANIDAMKASNIRILLLIVFGFVFVVIFSHLIVRSVVKPIKELMIASAEVTMGKVDVKLPDVKSDEVGELTQQFGELVDASRAQAELIRRISKGDLTDEYEPRSEVDVVGQSLTEMLERNNSVLKQVQSSTKQISIASSQIADSSQTLASGSTQQAASVQELSSALEEMMRTSQGNAEMADEASKLANNIKHGVEKSNQKMGEMVSAVNAISDSSRDIHKVIKVIDDIAFQTNILALNAAVEAARAGQQGKGFAVVAEEVRNLATKSAEAASDTGRLIADSIEKAELGAGIANETAASLTEIVADINNSSQIINEISNSSKEQSIGISQISHGINQVSTVTQQTGAAAEQLAASSEQMNSQTDMLEDMVAMFKLKDAN